VVFLLVLMELFSLSVTAEVLRAKLDRKSVFFCKGWVSICQIFMQKGTSPPIIFAQIVRLTESLQLCRRQFSHEDTLWQTYFLGSAILTEKGCFAFLSPPLLLGATYDVYLRLIGRHVVLVLTLNTN